MSPREEGRKLRLLGFYWGVVGVIGILFSAIFRLSAKVIEMSDFPLSLLQWLTLILFTLYMAYAEGYKGFHLNFAPRVVARANCFRQESAQSLGILPLLFAPLFCMGYFHATNKRKLTSFLVTAAIVVVVIAVGMMPQPWRGVIDVGVVTGLGIGIGSIINFWIQVELGSWAHPIKVDLPE